MAEGVQHGKCGMGIQDICGPNCQIYDKEEKTCSIVIIARELKKANSKKTTK